MNFDKNTSFFISIAGMDPSWIVGKIAEDIQKVLKSKGYLCNYGAPENYNNEDVCYHMGWAYAKPQRNAKINSVFITHIDDKFKEDLIVSMKDKFDSFICMSHESKHFLVELGFDKNKVYGVNLPTRNQYVKPLSLGMFCSYYDDKRKNESWILDFCKRNSDINLVNFVFIGPGWGKFLTELSKFDCSIEWHNTSRKLPFEYQFQQNKLSDLDYYFYLGFDGGAMGTYDAYAYGNKLLISNQCYHKSIPNIENPFNSYNEFEEQLSQIIQTQKNKILFFEENTPLNYVSKLITIWGGQYIENVESQEFKKNNIILKRRKNYFPFSMRRFLSHLKRKFN